ncbi:major capsid protein [Gordonia sp. NPDC062954]|uniref:major capsid protein n=1 Tax=Gordonia sp. NPDC062954 TaxID=3364003 RepID=UPI0037CA203C
MTNILTPQLTDQRVSVATIMSQPTWIRVKIGELAENNELLSVFYTPLGTPVQGGGILHPRLSGAERYTADDVVERSAGNEYQRVRAVDPEYRLALVRDYGASVEITDEEIDRGDISALNNKILQLTNTLVRKLNVKALAAIDDASPDTMPASEAWDTLVTVGPPEQLTPNAQRPLADMIRTKRLFSDDRLGFVPDTLLVSATDAENLAVGYGEELDKVMTAAGLTLMTNPYVAEGRNYVLQKGKPGIVGYERQLTVDIIDERKYRHKLIQVYAVPSYAVDRPQAVKVITGTVTP